MIWDDHMFIGKRCRGRAKTLQYRISNGLAHPGVFLLVLPQSEHAVLEIIPSLLLLQKDYPRENLRVVGMAATRSEAFSLAEQIIAGAFQECGKADVEAFISQL
ncbi:MAG: hypothetical protein LIO96_07230 [Lachnospiraceae bacterium]|nr:hypothetical protein [Lachnospiraceae bacterium]